MTPLVSVVIPTYNRAALVGDAVASALAQDGPALEVLVVDDGSTDDTLAMLRERFANALAAGRLQLLEGQHRGASAARNLGVDAATGTFIAFLDSDDLFLPGKLQRSLALFDAAPDRVLVHTGWIQHDTASGERTTIEPTAEGDARADLLRFTRIATPTVVVRRDAFHRAGGFDPEMFLVEDYDTWTRISAQGPVGLIPEPLSEVRLHGANSPRDPDSIRRNQHAMIRGFFARCDTMGLESQAWFLAHADIVNTAEYVDGGQWWRALRSGSSALWQGLRADPHRFPALLGQVAMRGVYRTPLRHLLPLPGLLRRAVLVVLIQLRHRCALLANWLLVRAASAWRRLRPPDN